MTVPGGESFAGITVPRGDPAELRSAAFTLQGLAGAMQGVGGQLRALPAQLASWQGLAQLMFTASVLASSGTADQAMQAFETGGFVVASFADALERAQRQARKAIAEARDAQQRINRAQGQIADARQRSQDAASRATTAASTVMATSLVGAPDVGAQAEQARAQGDLAQATSDERNAQRGLETAQEDLRRARREGHAAEQAARDAGHAAGQALWAIAGASPDHVAPGPPATPATGGGPAPHPQPQHHSFWGGVWDTVKGGAKDVAGFAEDTAKGVGDFAVGVEHTGVMLAKLSPVYGLVDPGGQQQEMQQLGQGVVYAWHHPGDFGKALIDWNDITNGHPGRAFGQLLPNIALTVLSGGAGAAAKGADGVNALSEASRLERGAQALKDSGEALGRAREAHGTLRPETAYGGKTVAADGSPTLSGWKHPPPPGFAHASPEQVRGHAEQIGHDLKPHVFDGRNRGGWDGRFYASHAEKQQALTSPDHHIAVDREMCDDCQHFLQRDAIARGKPRVAMDPYTTRLFHPDGRIIIDPSPADFPAIPLAREFSPARGVGAGAAGLLSSHPQAFSLKGATP